MSIIKDSVYGFVIGDAMGVPVEFQPRNKLVNNPVTTMIGYGSYTEPEGTWSDDTSMTLATMDSIIKENGSINYNDIANRFCNWINHADYTATDNVFDIGITTKYALMKYWSCHTEATKCGGTNIGDNGNGSLMRMLPIALYCYYKKLDDNKILEIVKNTSSITHAHERSILGCYIYVKYILYLIEFKDKYIAYDMIKKEDYSMFSENEVNEYRRILKENVNNYHIDDIKSTGYVVYSLETALWVILNTNSFNEVIIKAINLGEDTDTIGAITGSMAGILYGYDKINNSWLEKLKNKEYISDLIEKFEIILNKK